MSNNFDISLDDLTSVTYNFNNSVGAVGATGSVYTSTGTNGTWSSSMPYVISTGSSWNQPSSTIQLNGEQADINVNGKSLCRAIEQLEQRLGWMVPNPEIEQEWAELKHLGDQYRQLESEIKEKMKVWETLKKTDL